jgi:hypothetical protein
MPGRTTGAGGAHNLRQRHRFARDPLGDQLVTVAIHGIDHGPATMQIDPDVTLR